MLQVRQMLPTKRLYRNANKYITLCNPSRMRGKVLISQCSFQDLVSNGGILGHVYGKCLRVCRTGSAYIPCLWLLWHTYKSTCTFTGQQRHLSRTTHSNGVLRQCNSGPHSHVANLGRPAQPALASAGTIPTRYHTHDRSSDSRHPSPQSVWKGVSA